MSGRRRPVPGPLGEFVEGFLVELADLGYSCRGWEAQLRLLRLLSGFMDSKGLRVEDLTSEALGEFIEVRRRAGTKMRSQRALVPLLEYLRGLGVVPSVPPRASAEEPTVQAFSQYLRIERGLASTTVAGYVGDVRSFFAAFPTPEQWRALTPGTVSNFAMRRMGRASARSLQAEAKALRALLRWMWLEEMVTMPLAEAIGPFASARGTRPPRALTSDEVAGLKRVVAEGSDRLRNEAMVSLMLRLGLRAGEVVGLRLEDIDWRAGVLQLSGKGGRVDPLPLPVDVGLALTAYLTEGRPRNAAARQVFLRSSAPHDPLSRHALTHFVSAALRRAEVTGPGGAHRLRHTTACGVLAAGGGLIESSQLLRHSALGVTAVYAKADLPALRTLIRPWPTWGGKR